MLIFKKRHNIFLLLFVAVLLVGCDIEKIINVHKVDDIVENPRVYEAQEISLTGELKPADDNMKIFGIGARLQGSKTDSNVYLFNYAAKIDFNQKVRVTGVFTTLTIPLFGSYLIIDAKSVLPCSQLFFC
jgi:hypothetical protein